ncbi:hypothetical protein BSKO_00029 [Bryopsis sp. KO-2023]|nr:hypothetical protein BSKO_00029 [Bryopsis sp. KO-2023]
MVEAITKKAATSKGGIKSFNQLLLKFPVLGVGFNKCRELFSSVDEKKNGVIDIGGLVKNLAHIGIEESDHDILLNIFTAADIDNSKRIDEKEFIILLAIFHLLKGSDPDFNLNKDVRTTFQVAEDTFCYFDSSRDGYIEKEEVRAAILKSDGGEMLSMAQQRFNELDWDKNGNISYAEFVYGLSRWVSDYQNE